MGAFQEVTWTTGTSSGGSPNNLPVAMPATVAAGDVLVCAIWNANLTPPAGWTLRASSNNISDRMRLYTKVAAGTEGGTTVNFTERAGTVAGLQFGAAVARYRFTASAIAEPYATSNNGFAEQFGSVGGPSYTETYDGPSPGGGTGHAIKLIAKFFWNLGGTTNPPPTYAISPSANLLNDLGSRTFRASTTAANGPQDGKLIVIDTDQLNGADAYGQQDVTFTAVPGDVPDMTINGVSVVFSTTSALLEAPVLPSAGGGELTRTARHMQFVNMPYEAHSAMLRRRGRRA